MGKVREKDWTVLSMLEWATDYFKQKGVSNPRLSIEWLLADVLGIRRLDLYLKYDRPLSAGELDNLRPKVKRRGMHEPLQYITGSADFMNCRIEVGPDVLIPRTETEQLVEMILNDHDEQNQNKHDERTRKNPGFSVLDIGTGSGCIPIALKKARKEWSCTGIDVSEQALHLARRNSGINQAEVEFLQADLLNLTSDDAFSDRMFNLIISNPPYVLPDEKKGLDPEVSDFEPEIALFHSDPAELYSLISEFAHHHLTESGTLYLECNDRLTEKIKADLEKSFEQVTTCPDYDNRDRFLKASKRRDSL